MKKIDEVMTIHGREVRLTNLDKVIWPADEGHRGAYTKADLIKYYIDVSPYLLPHLAGRPFVMSRYPDGINSDFFYQKDCPEYAPEWIETYRDYASSSDRTVDYILCNNLETLVWLANQACIEMHPWLAKADAPGNPDIAVFDLDPMYPSVFEDSRRIAHLVKKALDEFGLKGFPKTSGATGIHVYIPLAPKYTYPQVRNFVEFICRAIHNICPEKTTLERMVDKRSGKVYLDYLQNSPGRTMACQYSLRPHPGAPVSTPVTWDEIGSGMLDPSKFNIYTIKERISKTGDLFKEFPTLSQTLSEIPPGVLSGSA